MIFCTINIESYLCHYRDTESKTNPSCVFLPGTLNIEKEPTWMCNYRRKNTQTTGTTQWTPVTWETETDSNGTWNVNFILDSSIWVTTHHWATQTSSLFVFVCFFAYCFPKKINVSFYYNITQQTVHMARSNTDDHAQLHCDLVNMSRSRRCGQRYTHRRSVGIFTLYNWNLVPLKM